MSDNWRPYQSKKLTKADERRISERVAKKIAKEKVDAEKAAEKATLEAKKKEAEDAQLTLF